MRLLIGLILFSLALTALIIFAMHQRSERIYREQLDKSPKTTLLDSLRFSC